MRSQRRVRLKLLAIVSSLWGASAAAYTTAPSASLKTLGVPGEQVLRPVVHAESDKGLERIFGALTNVEVDSLSGQLRLLEGPDLAPGINLTQAPNQPHFESTCRQFLSSHPSYFGVRDADLTLNVDAQLLDAEDQFLKFYVARAGIRIADAEVNCRFKFGKLVQVTNLSFSEAKGTAQNSATNLHARVLNQLGFKILASRGDEFRVAVIHSQYILRHVARYLTQLGGETFLAAVDRGSGDIFEIKPTTFYANIPGVATTSYYERNYNDNVMVAPFALGKIYSSTSAFATNVNGLFNAPDTAVLALRGFDGSRVKVAVRSGTLVNTAATMTNGSWRLDHVTAPSAVRYADKAMAQANVYFHINRIIAYARTFIQPAWFNQVLTANTNILDSCNANWDGTTINFFSAGSNCANTALIADVIYHEWGHGLDENTGGIVDGAYSEGFGDIMALLFSRSNIASPGFFTDGRSIRDLAPNRIYPTHIGEVHAEGLIIAGTFYDMYEDLLAQKGADEAGQILAKYAFKGIYAASRYTEMYNALKIIDDNDGNPATMSPNYCVLNRAFAAHGLATAAAACAR